MILVSVRKNKKPKTSLEIAQSIRRTWDRNPVTKVHGEQEGYSKKDRKKGKEQVKEEQE